MIVIMGGEKGGTGKTTLATNLAAMRVLRGRDVLLVDTDKQESSNYWAITRAQGEAASSRVVCAQKLGGSVLRLGTDPYKTYEDIIVDAGGRNSIELRATMTIADALFIPVQPSQFDLWTLARMNELVREARVVNPKLRAVVLINRASTNPGVSETADTVKILRDYPNLAFTGIIIRDRIAYRKAASLGLSVIELEPSDSKAIEEMHAFYREVYNDWKTFEKQPPRTQNE